MLQLEHKHLWTQGMCNKLGRLSEGYGNIKGNNTLYFIPKSNVSYNKKVIYARIICSIRSQKSEIYKVRITASSNIVNYKGDLGIPACSIKTIKLL